MPDEHTQTPMTGNRIEAVLKEIRALKNANYCRAHQKRRRANQHIVYQVGKRMAERIVRAVQKTMSPEGKGTGDGPGKREGNGGGPQRG